MKTKILIVDDLRENIVALSSLIEDDNIEIQSALNANEALGLLLDHDFALALLDVQMPSMSGFELARLIRGVERGRHLPIIFVTAQQRESSLIFEGYDTGAVDVLFKPLDPHIVRSKVRVFVQLDIQSKMLQNQIRHSSRLKEEAETANIAKSRFLANMSHEIRTPLTAVLGFADILAQEKLSSQERNTCLESIQRNGQLLLRLIDDVLDLSRIEAQKFETETAPFDLRDLLEDLKTTLSPRAEEKGIDFTVNLEEKKDLVFSSDPIRIKQILLNIAGNAIKFTSQGQVSVTARVEPWEEMPQERKLLFVIEDTGIGLSAFEAKRLFQPFVQADNSTRRIFGGTGLGLVISRQLARALGGEVTLKRSETGRGSTFEMTIRARVLTQKLASLENRNQNSSEPTADLTGKRILVVDDVVDNRVLIERYLVSAGLEVGLAAGGEEAIEKTNQESWDALLMDIQMPKMDGYETTRQLRKSGFNKPIVALTAHALKEELNKCIDVGCTDTLTKPVSRKDLVQKLAAVLRTS